MIVVGLNVIGLAAAFCPFLILCVLVEVLTGSPQQVHLLSAQVGYIFAERIMKYGLYEQLCEPTDGGIPIRW